MTETIGRTAPAFTPGPWTHKPGANDSGNIAAPDATRYGGTRGVASIQGQDSDDEYGANIRLVREAPAMYEALREIEKGEGAYNRDPLEHCTNTVEKAQRIAREVLARIDGARIEGPAEVQPG